MSTTNDSTPSTDALLQSLLKLIEARFPQTEPTRSRIRTSASTDKVMKAMLAVQAKVSFVGKSKENTHFKFAYSTLEDVIGALHKAANKNGLVIMQSVEDLQYHPQKMSIAQANIVTRVSHAESGQFIETDCPGTGEDKSDKASYKAVTGGRRYALLATFNLVSSDDPEATNVEEIDTVKIVDAFRTYGITRDILENKLGFKLGMADQEDAEKMRGWVGQLKTDVAKAKKEIFGIEPPADALQPASQATEAAPKGTPSAGVPRPGKAQPQDSLKPDTSSKAA